MVDGIGQRSHPRRAHSTVHKGRASPTQVVLKAPREGIQLFSDFILGVLLLQQELHGEREKDRKKERLDLKKQRGGSK